ncbi:MAG TPA: hypothetical protein VER96_30180 [Polyangiaceae bacterium]|nr:hypothetical protein [Polyangiaceae bacterium]
MRDLVFTRRGREQRGTTRFAPGTLVYAHAPYSGDGYQRVFFTGRDRETGRWATSICETRRFDSWHRVAVEDPELLLHLATHGAYWRQDDLSRDLLPLVGARLADPVAFGWSPELWDRLTRSALAPHRPRLAECAAIILGYDETEAERVSAQSDQVGALLAHAARAPGSASPTKLARALTAWARFAPEPITTTPDRFFTKLPTLSTRHVGPAPPITRHPSTLTGVVAWCSDPPGVLTAESLARRIAATLGFAEKQPILWRIASRSELLGWLRRPSDVVPSDPQCASFVSAMRNLVVDLVDSRPRAPAPNEVTNDPYALNAELVGLGYALDAIGPDRIELLAPDLPIDADLRRALRRP